MNAALYDTAMWPVEKLLTQELRQRIASTARGRVLEIGIGTGSNLPYYPVAIEELAGIDPNEDSLARARRRAVRLGRRVTLHVAHAEELPFADHVFDTVIATFVFCTVSEPERALLEIKRVLKPQGQFKLIEHVRAHNPWGAKIQDFLTPLWSRIADGCHLNRETLKIVRANGFEVQKVQEHLRGLVIEIEARVQSHLGGV